MATTPENFLKPENRRIAPRIPLGGPVSCNGRDARGINISLSGMRLVSPRPLTRGTQTHLQVRFGDDTVNLEGQTVWSEPLGPGCVAGVTFVIGSELKKLQKHLRPLMDLG